MAKRKASILQEKLDENYENIGDFMKRTRIPVSMETVRRLITERLPVNTASLIMIAKYLGCSNEEIRDILQNPGDYLKDAKELKYAEDFISLMGFGGVELSGQDKILLENLHALRDANLYAFNLLIRSLIYVCQAEGLDCDNLACLLHPAGDEPPETKGKRS